MKAFLRTLNSKEIKGYVFSLYYTFFLLTHLFLVKLLQIHYNISYLTLLTQTGSIISLMSFYRIFMTLNKIATTSSLDFMQMFHGGFFSFMSYAFITLSLYYLSVTNFMLIFRLYPFIFLFAVYGLDNYPITQNEFVCFIVSLLSIFVILIPGMDNQLIIGVVIVIFALTCKVIATKYWKRARGITVDFLLLSVGFLSAGIGGVLMITTRDKIEYLNYNGWIYIVLNGLSTYYARIFLLKVTKYIRNVSKIVVFNTFGILVAMVVEIFVYGEVFSVWYYGLGLVLVNSVFFTKELIKGGQTKTVMYK